jgi:hypothetical protein
MEGSGSGGQQAGTGAGGGEGKNPFEELRKKMEAAGKTQHGPSSSMGTQQHLEQARKLLYAKNSAEARNVASFMRLTNYAWSGISFALLFAFSMSALYKYFKKPEPQEKVSINATHEHVKLCCVIFLTFIYECLKIFFYLELW